MLKRRRSRLKQTALQTDGRLCALGTSWSQSTYLIHHTAFVRRVWPRGRLAGQATNNAGQWIVTGGEGGRGIWALEVETTLRAIVMLAALMKTSVNVIPVIGADHCDIGDGELLRVVRKEERKSTPFRIPLGFCCNQSPSLVHPTKRTASS